MFRLSKCRLSHDMQASDMSKDRYYTLSRPCCWESAVGSCHNGSITQNIWGGVRPLPHKPFNGASDGYVLQRPN